MGVPAGAEHALAQDQVDVPGFADPETDPQVHLRPYRALAHGLLRRPLRPVYHRKEERIRAHVILCWLALLLVRIAETTTGATWNKIADELDLLTLGTFTGPADTFRQTAELTKAQRDCSPSSRSRPNKIIEATPATP
jgi:hypothetical protein